MPWLFRKCEESSHKLQQWFSACFLISRSSPSKFQLSYNRWYVHSHSRSLQERNCPSQKEPINVADMEEQQLAKCEAQDLMGSYLPRQDQGNILSSLVEKTLLFYSESYLKTFWANQDSNVVVVYHECICYM